MFQCSIDCSNNKKKSRRTRLVECRNSTDAAPMEHTLCAPQRKPRSRRRCSRRHRNKCPQWSTSKWSQVATCFTLLFSDMITSVSMHVQCCHPVFHLFIPYNILLFSCVFELFILRISCNSQAELKICFLSTTA